MSAYLRDTKMFEHVEVHFRSVEEPSSENVCIQCPVMIHQDAYTNAETGDKASVYVKHRCSKYLQD